MQLAPPWRRRWGALGACGSGLVLAAALVASPYVLITGSLTNKPSVNIMVGTYPDEPDRDRRRSCFEGAEPRREPTAHGGTPSRGPLLAAVWAVWLKHDGAVGQRLRMGLGALVDELVRAF